MKKPVLRQIAEQDIENGFNHYLQDASAEVATSFIGAVDTGLQYIEHHPGAGSPRYGELLDTPGLRSWLVSRFPYILFYIERDAHLDVIRLLHQHSDIPAQLRTDISDT